MRSCVMGPLPERGAPAGVTHEHRQVPGDLGHLLDQLHAGRSHADHGDALAVEVQLGGAEAVLGSLRPVGRVDALALEGVDAGDPRHLGPGQRPERREDEARRHRGAVRLHETQRPEVVLVVQHRAGDLGVEDEVLADVHDLGRAVDVPQDVRLGGEALRPVPLLHELVVPEVAVDLALGVGAAPRVAVVVPDAADVVRPLDPEHPVAHLAQPVRLVQAADARHRSRRRRSPALSSWLFLFLGRRRAARAHLTNDRLVSVSPPPACRQVERARRPRITHRTNDCLQKPRTLRSRVSTVTTTCGSL